MGNYSLMSVPGKTMEMVFDDLKDKLKHLQSKEVICDSQHSFTNGR